MASGRSGSSSSFTSSSLGGGGPPSQGQHASPVHSTFTPTSAAISALTAESSIPQSPLGPLDLGPPGYHATIKLFERTANETTIYLGPWEIVGTNPRRIVWQCSYAGDVLEHFLPSDSPNELHPFTLHAQHRRFGDPREMELYLSFLEPHRLRYMTRDGVVCDDYVEIKYEFTTIEGSIQFQGDIRTRDLIDWFDVDVVWSDTTRRTDSYGNVRGLGTIQRMKLWRDRYSTFHYLTVWANHQWRWKEFLLDNFEKELRQRDDRHRRVQLATRPGRRGSASGSSTHSREQRRFSAAAIFGGRRGSSTQTNGASSASASAQGQASPELRYLGVQFSRNPNVQTGTDDYSRFLIRWDAAHDADGQFEVSFPTNHIELPSPYLNGTTMQQTLPYVNGYHANGANGVNGVNGIIQLPSPALNGLAPVAEPPDGPESDDTQ